MPSLKRWLQRSNRTGSIASIERHPTSEVAATVHRNTVAGHDTASDEHPQGLAVVYEDPDASLDIVAVHGLNGHRDMTWTAANGVHWLRDLLPKDLSSIRVLTWGYDANTHSRNGLSCQYLYDHALELVSELTRKRTLTGSTQRPIIFVAHSLGGIVVKSALIHSDAARKGVFPEHRSIKNSTYGVIYMGTPHQGSNGVRLGCSLVNITSIFTAADDRLLKHLERDSEWLQQQLQQYNSISNEFVTKFAYETCETPMISGHKTLVVQRESAVVPGHADAEPIAINTDHIKMVKISKSTDMVYAKVSETLQIMAVAARANIQSRWEEEAQIDDARGNINPFTLPLDLSSVVEAPCFVAREAELSQMNAILGKTGERRTVILHGLGGMGKTQLAREYIRRHRTNFTAAIWLNARDTTSLRQSFERTAQLISRYHPTAVYMSTAIQSRDPDKCAAAVKRWLDEPENGRWLVVYDNYDNPQLGSANPGDLESRNSCDAVLGVDQAFDIRPFLPNAFHGAVIITTRSSRVKLGEYIEITKLTDRKDAIEILASTSCRDPDADGLAQRLDGLPLALATAGIYLQGVSSTTLKEYLKMYDESWLRLQTNSPQILSYERAMYSIWNISYTHIKHLNPASAKLLDLWAYFDNEDLWFELLFDWASWDGRSEDGQYLDGVADDKITFDAAVRLLCDYGLVEPATSINSGTESQGYSMHECVHSWSQHVLNAGRDKPRMARLATVCVAKNVLSHDPEEDQVFRCRVLKHADRCWARIKDGMELDEGDGCIYHILGSLYRSDAQYSEAEDAYNRALRDYDKTMGPENISTFITVKNLGTLYIDLGRYAEAEEKYDQALRGYEKTLGPEDVLTLNTVYDLGNLYRDRGRYAEAEEKYDRALRAYEKAYGPEDVLTINTIFDLGTLYLNQSRYAEARGMYDRALRGYEKAFGPEHMSALNTVHILGDLYKDQGRYAKAKAMYSRALRGYEKALGPENMSTLNTAHNLGNLYKNRGRYAKAKAMYDRALRGYEKVVGPEDESTLNAVNSLAIIYRIQGRYAEAEEMYDRALRGCEKVLGPKNPLTLSVANNLGRLYTKQGRYAEAEEVYEDAFQGREKVLGPKHKLTRSTARNLGRIYRKQGRRVEAKEMFDRASGPKRSRLNIIWNLGFLRRVKVGMRKWKR
ncbi:hypothetical protein F4861DRAFT_540518 [Xylaria intraflava]|nr:hypothetical protein F4861DRAFT_540518 [Xylaria intraflava]